MASHLLQFDSPWSIVLSVRRLLSFPTHVLTGVAQMSDAVIVAYGRSPIGRAFKGSLIDIRPDELASRVVDHVLGALPNEVRSGGIDDLICGCGLPGGEQGFNLGRIISILSRLDAPGTTITRYCASSLQATRMAFHAIAAGEGSCFIIAGVECVSRYGAGFTDPPEAQNPLLKPGNEARYPDIYIAMGNTAENVAKREHVTREEMDAYALRSQQRTARAIDAGFYEGEIIPVSRADGTPVTKDDGPRPSTTLDGLAALKPAFLEDGLVTAGNSCPLNDGAAALVVMSRERATSLGLTPLARIVATGLSQLEPEYMGLGPVESSRRALEAAHMSIDDIDLVEMNEAFAAQIIPSTRALGIDPFDDDRFNVHGGAIALGHPFGMTGARLIGTLVRSLHERDKHLGLATLCVGGGMGMAMIVERL